VEGGFNGKITTNETYDITTSVRTEKNKDDIFEVTGSAINSKIDNNKTNFNIFLSRKEMDKYIGIDSNSVSGDVFILDLSVMLNTYPIELRDIYHIYIVRYSFLNEQNFNEEEINDIVEASIPIFNDIYHNYRSLETEINTFLVENENCNNLKTVAKSNNIFIALKQNNIKTEKITR